MNTFEDIEEGLRLTLNELPIRRTIVERQSLKDFILARIDPTKKYSQEDRARLLDEALKAGFETTEGTVYYYINSAQKEHKTSAAPAAAAKRGRKPKTVSQNGNRWRDLVAKLEEEMEALESDNQELRERLDRVTNALR